MTDFTMEKVQNTRCTRPDKSMQQKDTDIRDGIAAGLTAYILWGFLPVYFKTVGSVDAFEVLAHRVIWAVPFGAIVLLIRRQWPEIKRVFGEPAILGWLSLSALLMAMNWFVYIWAIQDERIFEASLGYYINPLTAMLVGVTFFGERLRRFQMIAVALALIGVLVLTVSGGKVPWVSLFLAISFTIYAAIRKQVVVGGMPGLFIETLWLLPFAAIWFVWLRMTGQAAFGSGDGTLTFLLVMAGPITAVPLLCFALAARRVTMTIIGFMQFVAPTIQFCTAIYYGEVLTTAHMICFGFIWAAVVVFSIDALGATKKPLPESPTGA